MQTFPIGDYYLGHFLEKSAFVSSAPQRNSRWAYVYVKFWFCVVL